MDSETNKKQIVLSLVQPTVRLPWAITSALLRTGLKMAEDYDCLFGAADLHSITVRTEPKDLKSRTIEIYAILLALGLSPEKNTIFVQSHVPQHSQLAWILNCYTQFGEATRMTRI